MQPGVLTCDSCISAVRMSVLGAFSWCRSPCRGSNVPSYKSGLHSSRVVYPEQWMTVGIPVVSSMIKNCIHFANYWRAPEAGSGGHQDQLFSICLMVFNPSPPPLTHSNHQSCLLLLWIGRGAQRWQTNFAIRARKIPWKIPPDPHILWSWNKPPGTPNHSVYPEIR